MRVERWLLPLSFFEDHKDRFDTVVQIDPKQNCVSSAVSRLFPLVVFRLEESMSKDVDNRTKT